MILEITVKEIRGFLWKVLLAVLEIILIVGTGAGTIIGLAVLWLQVQ